MPRAAKRDEPVARKFYHTRGKSPDEESLECFRRSGKMRHRQLHLRQLSEATHGAPEFARHRNSDFPAHFT